MSKFKLTIGADPEFFAMEGSKVVMACGRFGGSKGAPVFLGDLGGYLEDGTAVEFNLPPTKTLQEMQGKIFALIAKFEQEKQVKVSYYSSAVFKPDELKKYAEAMAIGCSPDRYAYGLRSAPSVSQFKNRRFAGGHIHIGIDPWPEGLEKVNLVRYLDLTCLAPYQYGMADTYRYPHYGYLGLYRETSYGIEWRSPDNHWCNPAFLEKGGDAATYARRFVSTVDNCMATAMTLLEQDGHGERLNKVIEDSIAAYNIVDVLSNRKYQRVPDLPSSVRGMYSTISKSISKLANTKAPKKGVKKTTGGLLGPDVNILDGPQEFVA